MSTVALIAEFVMLFVVLPLGYRFSPRPLPALPLLWLVAVYCYWRLRGDRTFSQTQLWNPQPFTGQLASILLIFAVGAATIWVGVQLVAQELLFGFVRTHPGFWALVMMFYPVLSVYPQAIVYRSFLMHRYASILPSEAALIVASAAAFAFMHIVFRNPLAVGLTFAGGLLFAWRYATTSSLLTSSVEHALYGCWLFTIGLGQYFYHGRIRLS